MAMNTLERMEWHIDEIFDLLEQSSNFMDEFLKKTSNMPIEEVLQNEYYVFLLKNGCFAINKLRRFTEIGKDLHNDFHTAKTITHVYEPLLEESSKPDNKKTPKQKVN